MNAEKWFADTTLDDWFADNKDVVDRFRAYWLRRNADAPDSWPMSMGRDEWEERFLAFLEGAIS